MSTCKYKIGHLQLQDSLFLQFTSLNYTENKGDNLSHGSAFFNNSKMADRWGFFSFVVF